MATAGWGVSTKKKKALIQQDFLLLAEEERFELSLQIAPD